jgi:hypothetical protein
MAKASIDIRSLARAHTETALNTLAGIMRQEDSPPAARVSAAQALLDRGWGKPAQAIIGGDEDDKPLAVQVIERVIVKASNKDR